MYICVVTYLRNSISRYQKVYDAWSEEMRTAGETKHFLTRNVYRVQNKSRLNVWLTFQYCKGATRCRCNRVPYKRVLYKGYVQKRTRARIISSAHARRLYAHTFLPSGLHKMTDSWKNAAGAHTLYAFSSIFAYANFNRCLPRR